MPDTPDKPDTPAGRPLCRGTTAKGEPCRKRAAVGSAWCGAHGGGKRPVGAPTKLDGAMVNRLEEIVERGVTWEVAAQAVGVHKSTLIDWRNRGADDLEAGIPTVFADLVDRLTRASAMAEVGHIANIARAGMVDWRASAFWLERRAAERFARKDRLDVDVSERAQPRVVTPDEPDKRATILELLASATRAPASLENEGTGEHP